METKQEALQAVAAFASRARAIIVNTSDGVKIAGLADKARDAAIHLFNKAEDPDELILQSLALECAERNRGETPDQLAQIILDKAAQFKQIRAKLDGLESRFETAVSMAPTDALAVQTYHGARALAIQELIKLGIPAELL